jgi:hypothetical protein
MTLPSTCGSHRGGSEKFYLLGYSSAWSIESQPKFRSLPPAFLLNSWSAHSSALRMGQYAPPKCRLTFNGLEAVTSHKTELFYNIISSGYNS